MTHVILMSLWNELCTVLRPHLRPLDSGHGEVRRAKEKTRTKKNETIIKIVIEGHKNMLQRSAVKSCACDADVRGVVVLALANINSIPENEKTKI